MPRREQSCSLAASLGKQLFALIEELALKSVFIQSFGFRFHISEMDIVHKFRNVRIASVQRKSNVKGDLEISDLN